MIQAAGLATESLSAHIGQRIRWARGMAQIFRIDNPLLGFGLGAMQRLCYLNAMLHFLSGIPRLIFLTAPLAFIFFNAYLINASVVSIILYIVPTLVQVKLTNSRIQGKFRHAFWGDVYETVLAWYITKPTTVALINPHKGKFNVTEKGGLTDEDYFDWRITLPNLLLLGINVIGMLVAISRIAFGDPEQIGLIIISMCWIGYNLLILGAAVAVAAEAKQVRRSHRISCNFDGGIVTPNGHCFSANIVDYSDAGVGLKTPVKHGLKNGDAVKLLMHRGDNQFSFPTHVCNVRGDFLGLSLDDLPLELQSAFVECTFSRGDAWLKDAENLRPDDPWLSFQRIKKVSLDGYKNIVEYAPEGAKPLLILLVKGIQFIWSFFPKVVSPVAKSS